ncbi:MAG: hypothetical protein KJ607_12660 [Bacteroidetes bacterium]|nr:hypothetical protein [Bacteroidota bacterium]
MDAHIEINLNVKIFKENDYYIAYSPELQISTQGNTYNEVQKRMKERISIFFEMALEKGILGKRLKELGWTIMKKEHIPPKEVTVPIELLMAKKCKGINYKYIS